MGQFHGLNTCIVENSQLRLEVLEEGGQRIIRLEVPGKTGNLLAELPSLLWPTPKGDYHPYGGHRLWLSPEEAGVTTLPEQGPLEISAAPGKLAISAPVQAETGMRKELSIVLDGTRGVATVEHRITNMGDGPARYAPWGITMMPLGGEAAIPWGPAQVDPQALLPDRPLALWPYTSMSDPRLNLQDRLIRLKGMAGMPPIKVGTFATQGWIGYLREGIWFVKRFEPRPELVFPDFGCNAETYTNASFVEIETLGPLVALQPGQTASHTEEWEVFLGVETVEDGLRLALAANQAAGEPVHPKKDLSKMP